MMHGINATLYIDGRRSLVAKFFVDKANFSALIFVI